MHESILFSNIVKEKSTKRINCDKNRKIIWLYTHTNNTTENAIELASVVFHFPILSWTGAEAAAELLYMLLNETVTLTDNDIITWDTHEIHLMPENVNRKKREKTVREWGTTAKKESCGGGGWKQKVKKYPENN